MGLPVQMWGLVMYRNQDIIPRTPATYSELMQSAKQVQAEGFTGTVVHYDTFFSGGLLYGLGGSFMDRTEKIIYENHTCCHNLGVVAARWRKGQKDECFKHCLTLDGNPGWKFETYELGLLVFEFSVEWMSKNGHEDIARYLDDRRGDIDGEFEKAVEFMVGEKLREIDRIKKRLLPTNKKEITG